MLLSSAKGVRYESVVVIIDIKFELVVDQLVT